MPIWQEYAEYYQIVYVTFFMAAVVACFLGFLFSIVSLVDEFRTRSRMTYAIRAGVLAVLLIVGLFVAPLLWQILWP